MLDGDGGVYVRSSGFASYIWKRIDGFVIDSIRNEVRAAGSGGMDLEHMTHTQSASGWESTES